MNDCRWMDAALREAAKAARAGEVPIGAVVVKDGRIVGRGYNKVEGRGSAAAHAEMLAIESASRKLGDWRLDGCAIYVTVEPCHMCLGAIYLARIARVVFGARAPRSGACGSIADLHRADLYGHHLEVTPLVQEAESLELLRKFFGELRVEDDKRRDARAG